MNTQEMQLALSKSEKYPGLIRVSTLMDGDLLEKSGFKILYSVSDPEAPSTVSALLYFMKGKRVPYHCGRYLNMIKADPEQIKKQLELIHVVFKSVRVKSSIPNGETRYYQDQLSSLTKLDISGDIKVSPSELRLLANLTHLNCADNRYVKCLNHLRGLEVLDISGNCGVNQGAIHNLTNLTVIRCANNHRVTDLNFAYKLEVVDISGSCGVAQWGLKLPRLRRLNCANNRKVYRLDFPLLEEANIDGRCGVAGFSLSGLKLKKLSCRDNNRIKYLAIPTLTHLNAGGKCGISQQTLTPRRGQVLPLKELWIDDNPTIFDVTMFKDLKLLSIRGDSGVGREGIRGLKLTTLHTEGNPHF